MSKFIFGSLCTKVWTSLTLCTFVSCSEICENQDKTVVDKPKHNLLFE